MDMDTNIKEDICEVGRRMYNRGFAYANDGNISVKTQDHIWVTPSGISKGYMTPEMLIKVGLDGCIQSSSGKATSELSLHLRIYRERPDVSAVIHAHPPFATCFAVAGISLDRYILAEAAINLGRVPVAEYGTPGTDEISDAVAKVIMDCDAILLENHGALTCGHELFYTYNKMESLEFYAQISYYTELFGKSKELSYDKIQKLIEYRKKYNCQGKHPAISE